MTEFATGKPKTYSHITDNHDKNKKIKRHKNFFIKRKIALEDYKHCLKASRLENKI